MKSFKLILKIFLSSRIISIISWAFATTKNFSIFNDLTQAILFQPALHGPEERLKIGVNCMLGNAIFNTRSGNIYLGNEVMIGHNAMLLTGIHDYLGDRLTIEGASRDIVVGSKSWISSGAIIIGPCVIGEGVIISAGSVVMADLPSNVLVGGNPARVIRNLD